MRKKSLKAIATNIFNVVWEEYENTVENVDDVIMLERIISKNGLLITGEINVITRQVSLGNRKEGYVFEVKKAFQSTIEDGNIHDIELRLYRHEEELFFDKVSY